MSSEEVEETDLAQEALDATEDETSPDSAGDETSPAEKSDKEEPTVPLHVHTALRTRTQTAEVAQARAEGALTALQQQQIKDAPAPKSPIDSEVERQLAENPNLDEEDVAITPKVYRAQRLYEEQVANQKAEKKATDSLRKVQLASVTKAKTEHDDWQEIVLAGDNLLTPGEVLDLSNAGADFGELTYTKCQEALARNAPESKPKTETAPEKKPSESEAEKVPTQQEILKGLNTDPQVEAAAQL